MRNHPSDEVAHFRRIPDFDNLELLHATYRTFSFARHAHETFAVGVVERGVQAFHYRGKLHTTPPGHLIVVNPGEMHTGFAATEAGYTYRMLYPSVSLMRHAAGEISGGSFLTPSFPKGVVHDQTLARDIGRLHRAFQGPATRLAQETLLLHGLADLIERHGSHPQLPFCGGREPRAVARTREYLDAHAMDNVSLTYLAQLVNLSSYRLVNVLRDAVGLPPHAYLTHVRITRAKRLLAAGQSVAHVAAETGFADQSHLTKHFKALTGVTPGRYARSSKNVQDISICSS